MKNNVFHLLHLSDPALPIGGFAHSGGLETYVQKGLVHDKKTAEQFVLQQLKENIRYNDATFVSLAWEACVQNSMIRIRELDELCSAVKLPFEMREASRKLGTRLIRIFEPFCSSPVAISYHSMILEQAADGHYSIAFGIYSAALNIDKKEALCGFYYNAAASMVTNAVKLVPLGQIQGQEILFSLMPLLDELAEQSMEPDEKMVGRCCPGFDLRCIQHEQLYSRLYMS